MIFQYIMQIKHLSKMYEIDIILYMYIGTIDTPSLQGRIEAQPDPQKVGAYIDYHVCIFLLYFTVKTI